jgi:hypothetical protein
MSEIPCDAVDPQGRPGYSCVYRLGHSTEFPHRFQREDNMMDTTNLMARVERTVVAKLAGGFPIGIIANPTHYIIREDYWEYSFIVAWQRVPRDHQPSPDDDGFVYATHRVHVNSLGDGACFDGHYDQNRESALVDLVLRSYIRVND